VDNKPRPEDELKKDQYEFEVGIREGTFGHSWVKYDLVVEAKGMSAAISGNGQRYKVDLHDFLIRRSKTHEKPCFVLEATRNNLRKSTRFGFDSEIEYENCFYVLSTVIRRAQYQNLERYMASY
jgi:hemolysin activation/secretion protein